MQPTQALGLLLAPAAPGKMGGGRLRLGLAEGAVDVGPDALPGQVVG
jgi:hypothetical protein